MIKIHTFIEFETLIEHLYNKNLVMEQMEKVRNGEVPNSAEVVSISYHPHHHAQLPHPTQLPHHQ